MKLGILSDSHGRAHRIRTALAVLDEAGAESLIHCGDVGGAEALEEFAGRRLYYVWGNTDSPWASWRPQIQALGLPWPEGPLDVTLEGKRIGVFHGHEHAFRDAVRSQQFDYVFYGHTHRPDDQQIGRTRLINPGALHRTSAPTVAVLNLATDELQFLPVETLD